MERKQADEALRESERLYSMAARYGRTAPWEILIQEGKVLADKNLSTLLGIEGREPPGWLDEWAEYLLPEDVELMATAIRRVTDGQDDQISVEYRNLGPDGTIRWMHAQGRVAESVDGRPSRIVGTTRDITEQKEAEEAMRASEERVSAILQNVADSVVTIDEAGVILSANQAFANTFGYSADEVVGKDVTILMPEPYRSGHAGYMNHYFESGISQILGKVPRELEAIGKDGRVFPIELMIGEAVIGGQHVFIGSMRDVSERKDSEIQLRRSEERLFGAHRTARLGHWELDVSTWQLNTYGELMSEFGLESGKHADWYETALRTVHSEDVSRVRAAFDRCTADGARFDETYRVVGDGGDIRHVRSIGEVDRDDAGSVVRMQGTMQDVTQQILIEDNLRASEARLRATMEGSLDGVYFHKAVRNDQGEIIDFEFVDVSERGLDMVPLSREELIGSRLSKAYPDAFENGLFDKLKTVLEAGEPLDEEMSALENVDAQWLYHQIVPYGDGVAFTVRDITERKASETQLRRSEERLVDAHRIAKLGHWEFDVATQRFTAYGEMFADLDYGGTESEFSFEDALRPIHPQDVRRVRDAFQRSFTDGVPYDETDRVVYSDGQIGYMRLIGEVIRDDSGAIVGMRGTTQDITEQKEAEEAIRRSEASLENSQRIANLGSWERDLATGVSIWSDQLYRILDLEPGAPVDSGQVIYHYIHPDDVENVRQAVGLLIDTGEPMNVEYRIQSALGHEKIVIGYGELIRDQAGNPIAIGGTVQDITALRQAEQQLQQAQKMETVGQLSAGVAHDFNNLLAVISGNLELAKARLSADSDLSGMLEAAFGASQRGADLTGRLLAYSRRQVLTPQPTDINGLTERLLGLARRTLGEAVEIVFEPDKGAWWAHVDPAQLENALLNLAINARDAMPDGGTLTIRTENVSTRGKTLSASETMPAGEYVVIELADTGTGMSEDVREKVFEPFFTTKEVGEGSGLGLSMVYGFANQSGGHVEIESAVGEGTMIRLYLPRSEQTSQDVPEVRTSTREVRSSGETVLIVEDDPDVRKLVVSLVMSLGYIVLEAGDASSALEVMENGTQVDLLLSDVILGKGMNGVELANQVRESHPNTKVLLMSGYTREAFTEEDGLGDPYELISKPFRMADLAQHIEVLLQ